MENKLILYLLNKFIKKEYDNMEISYLLIRKEPNEKEMVKCMAIDRNDDENAIEITMNEEQIDISPIHDWSFSIDDVFYDLENGYKIVYIPLETHYGLWHGLNELQDEIDHTEGMQIYLQYCLKNGITAEVLSTLGNETIDIMYLHKEVINGYEIIHELSIEDNSTVIGYNPDAHSKYVIWSTTKNRKYGYELGHYYIDFEDTLHDFESRTNVLVKRNYETIKRNIIHEKELTYER